MRNVLIIGNGFDIAHGLKTGYKDFVTFCECIKDFTRSRKYHEIKSGDILDVCITGFDILKERMDLFEIPASISRKFVNYLKDNSDRKIKKEFLMNCVDNYWLNHIYANKNTLGERWCDLEYLIGMQVEALAYCANNIDKIKDGYTEYDRNYENIEIMYNKINEVKSPTYHKKVEKLASEMYEALNSLTFMLEMYLSRFLNEKRKTIELFEGLAVDYVLSFNYTNTYLQMYKNKKVGAFHFIHGCAEKNRSKDENNMVFGIGQEIKNSSEDEFDYVMFQKYYQRIIKKTGSTYKKWFSKKETMNVYIYGHSLDEPDGDIIREFIEYDKSKVYIFYYDQKSFNSIVVNLIKIFTKDKIIELTGSGKIEFVECNDKEKIKSLIQGKDNKNRVEEKMYSFN